MRWINTFALTYNHTQQWGITRQRTQYNCVSIDPNWPSVLFLHLAKAQENNSKTKKKKEANTKTNKNIVLTDSIAHSEINKCLFTLYFCLHLLCSKKISAFRSIKYIRAFKWIIHIKNHTNWLSRSTYIYIHTHTHCLPYSWIYETQLFHLYSVYVPTATCIVRVCILFMLYTRYTWNTARMNIYICARTYRRGGDGMQS